MGLTNDDILIEIPDEDLPKLEQMYEDHKEWAPHVYSIIETVTAWKQRSGNKYMTIMSPNNCWREDGTFFVLMHYYTFDLFIFTLDESCKNIYNALVTTKILDTNYTDRACWLYCIHEKLYPAVMEAMKTRRAKIGVETVCDMYSIPKEVAINFNTECPPEVYIKALDPTHAHDVDQEWRHRYKNSENCISLLITMNGGYGVFLKSNDELVAWMLISMMGQLAYLATKKTYRKRGYGSLITKYVAKKLAERGYNAFGTAGKDNEASPKMFEKIGFRSLGVATYTLVSFDQQI